MDTAEERDAKRAAIESTHNQTRDAIEKQYTADKIALNQQYHADIAENRAAKEAALVAAGLNSDGSDPQERPTG